MAVLQMVEAGPVSPDPIVARLDELLDELAGWVDVAREGLDEVEDEFRMDRVARLERLRAVTAAVQVAEQVRFAQSQVAEQLTAGVHPRDIGKGIADQLAAACHLSPYAGSRRLSSARALWFDLPQTYGLLTVGRISERVAETVVTETRHLDAATRRAVDATVCAAGIDTMGVREAEACVRKAAYEADRLAYVQRGKTERLNRRVTLRPARDTMSFLTGFLPVEQGVACLAALKRATDTVVAAGDERTRDQIMADTFVERLTGQACAEDVNVEVSITMPVESLLDPDNQQAATINGHGPIPADLARQLIKTTQGKVWWRRLFTSPTGQIIGGDPSRRRFDGWLAKLIRLRDQTCRTAYCDAPIRHLDHIQRHADGGQTTYANGRGLCARCNYVAELARWQVSVIHTGLDGHPHTTITRTPTGHHYLSRAPDPP